MTGTAGTQQVTRTWELENLKFLELEILDFSLSWPYGLLSLLCFIVVSLYRLDFPESLCSKPKSSHSGSLQFIAAPIPARISVSNFKEREYDWLAPATGVHPGLNQPLWRRRGGTHRHHLQGTPLRIGGTSQRKGRHLGHNTPKRPSLFQLFCCFLPSVSYTGGKKGHPLNLEDDRKIPRCEPVNRRSDRGGHSVQIEGTGCRGMEGETRRGFWEHKASVERGKQWPEGNLEKEADIQRQQSHGMSAVPGVGARTAWRLQCC